MAEVTICPHLLVDYSMKDPADIEEYIISPLIEILKGTYSLNIEVVLSKHIVNAMGNSFPWDKMTNPQWRGYLLDWSRVIQKHIETKATIIEHDIHPTAANQGLVCNCITQQTNDIFVNFLNAFIKDKFAQNLHSEGIISTDQCGHGITYKNTLPVKIIHDLPHVKHPWLRTYNPLLPYNGQYKFEPQTNWKNNPTPIRGPAPNYGYKDIKGYFWEWDTLHKDHWNVQMGGVGNYMNITPDGRKL
ncbi:hypothetical protein ACWIJ6_07790 [Aeromonas piscicola]